METQLLVDIYDGGARLLQIDATIEYQYHLCQTLVFRQFENVIN